MIQESLRWHELQDAEGFINDGYPFHEGFPRAYMGKTFTVMTRDAIRHPRSTVYTSTQYRAEGLRWNLGEETIPAEVVVAWVEEQPS